MVVNGVVTLAACVLLFCRLVVYVTLLTICIGQSRYIAFTNLPIIAVFVEYPVKS